MAKTRYIKFIINLRPKIELFYVIFFLILSTFFEFLFVSLVPYLLNNLVNEKSNFNFFNFIYGKNYVFFSALLIIFLFFLIKNLFFFINQFFFYKYSFKISNTLSSFLFSKYIREKYQVFINSSNSLFFNKILNNIESVRLFITNGLTFVAEIFVFLGLSAIVLYNSNFTSSFAILFIAIFSLFYIFLSRNLASSWSEKKQLH